MASSAWFQWTGGSWTAIAGDPRAQTIVLGQTATITDANGNVWALVNVNFGQITVNGVVDTSSNNVTELAYLNGVMWRFVSSIGLWSYWTAGPAPTPTPSPTPVPTPTPTPVSSDYITPGVGSFSTGGNTYTLTAAGAATENGSPIPGGGGTSAMELYQGIVYGQDSATGNWFTWNQSIWTGPVTAPPYPFPNPTPTPTPLITATPTPTPTATPTPTPAPAPGPVSNITTGVITPNSIVVTWTAPTMGGPVAAYLVGLGTSASGPFQIVGATSLTTFTADTP